MQIGMLSKYKISKKHCLRTARLLTEKYLRYCMPTIVHKVLIQGYRIIESAVLLIGQLSEACQEARNKNIRKFREDFSRNGVSEAGDGLSDTDEIVCLIIILSADSVVWVEFSHTRQIKLFDWQSVRWLSIIGRLLCYTTGWLLVSCTGVNTCFTSTGRN